MVVYEKEYLEALKKRYQLENPILDSLRGTREETELETRRINRYKSKIKQSESQIEFQKKLRDQLIVDAVRAGEPITSIAWAAGVSRSTVYNILDRA